MRKRIATLCIGLLIVAYIISLEARLYWVNNVAAQYQARTHVAEDRIFELYRELAKPLP